jgi:hypothetical protein
VPSVVQNVEMAIETPSDNQDRLAAMLIEGLLGMPETVTRQQQSLVRSLSRLS